MLDDPPLLAVPLGQTAGGMVALEIVLVIRVVGDDHAPEIGVAGLEMGEAGSRVILSLRQIEFLDQVGNLNHLMGVHVHLEELALHAQHIDLVVGIGQMLHGRASTYFNQILHGLDVALGIDDMGTEEELVARDSGRSDWYRCRPALRVLLHVEILVDDIEPCAKTGG